MPHLLPAATVRAKAFVGCGDSVVFDIFFSRFSVCFINLSARSFAQYGVE